jgi:cytochrome c oxidase cbb3-type subunit 3
MTKAGEDRPMMDHEYDGIQEYDNPMPRWWVWLFILTILFVPVYYLTPGDTFAGAKKDAMYAKEMAAFKLAHPEAPKVTAAALALVVADKNEITKGAALFQVNCISCHGPDGGGIIGPNLTDDYWIHGGSPINIHTTITEGVLAKGMPPWGKMLKSEQILSLTAYVLSLHDSHPAKPKAPEGVKEP